MKAFTFKKVQPGLKVASLTKAKKFYQDLGFEDVFQNNDTHLVISKDEVILHLSTEEGSPAILQIIVENIDGLYEFMVQSHVRIIFEIGNRPWGNRDFTIADPDNNQITFSQAL